MLPALRTATRPTPAFTTSEPLVRNAVFVEPALVAEVRFTEATERGLLRQPVLLRLRADKRVEDADELPAAETGDRRRETGDGRCERLSHVLVPVSRLLTPVSRCPSPV